MLGKRQLTSIQYHRFRREGVGRGHSGVVPKLESRATGWRLVLDTDKICCLSKRLAGLDNFRFTMRKRVGLSVGKSFHYVMTRSVVIDWNNQRMELYSG